MLHVYIILSIVSNVIQVADKDGDDFLEQDEFKAFLHPEEYNHMKEVVIDEAFDDMDTNKDGQITLAEYIGL